MNLSVNGQSQVPPGFRFHPTEEELLHYYLRKKVTSEKIDLDVIRDVDLNKLEPWDIQEKCKIGSDPQNDWYFFSHKDKKYPTGTRTNRATAAGFWKATGRDKVIYSNCKRIGMRKTLVFYKGRAPHGQKSDWIMHEYRLDDNAPDSTGTSLVGELNSAPEEGWVVCRVFKKKNYHKALESPHALVQTHPGNDGVLDQILTYMGRSSKQQNVTKNGNNNNNNNIIINGDDDNTMQFSHAIQAARFLHLPPLETQSNIEIISPLTQSFEDMLTETENNNTTEPADDIKTGPTDWVALDRLVASQLNGQVDTSKSYVADDLNDSLYFPLVDHRPFGRPNSQHENSQVNEVEFWSYTNSSSSPSDPLSHLSV